MNTHTPGPWHIDATGICASNGRTLLSTDAIGGEDEGEPHANTRLIAAAPELYEALRETVERAAAHGWILPPSVSAALAKVDA